MKRLVLIAILSLCATPSAFAEGTVIDAGKTLKPSTPRISGENQIDLWSRQLQYRDQRIEFRQILADRQESFANARRQAYNAYVQNLASLNASRTTYKGETE